MHNNHNNHHLETGALSFLAGIAVGGALGVLFAPATGVKTRRRITRAVEDSRVQCEDLIDRTRDAAAETFGTVRRAVGK